MLTPGIGTRGDIFGPAHAAALRMAVCLIFSLPLDGCATGADLRSMLSERVPGQIEAALVKGEGRFDIRRERLRGWVIESFTIASEPPFQAPRDAVHRSGKQVLVPADADRTHEDRYWGLSTYWMVDHCNAWVLSVRRQYEAELKTSKLKIGPVTCNRLVTEDRAQVFDVIIFSVEIGALATADVQATGRRLRPHGVYGLGVRGVEPQLSQVTKVGDFVLVQETARRYTYRSTFLHAEIGKRRIYDSYILMLAGAESLVVIQTLYPPDLAARDMWRNTSTVLNALYQQQPGRGKQE